MPSAVVFKEPSFTCLLPSKRLRVMCAKSLLWLVYSIFGSMIVGGE